MGLSEKDLKAAMQILKETKSTENKQKPPTVHVANVVRHGDQIIVPEKMPLKDAIELLKRRELAEEEKCMIVEAVDAFPWDGALALKKAMDEMFGWSNPETIESFFG